jgi:hypothetical protein
MLNLVLNGADFRRPKVYCSPCLYGFLPTISLQQSSGAG